MTSNLLIGERHAAIKRLATFGITVSRKMNLDSLVKTICKSRGEPIPPHRDGKIKLVHRFIGKSAPVQLPNFIPLRESQAMRDALARVAAYRMPGYTDRLRTQRVADCST